MNWLDPQEVEAWLAEKRDDSWHGHPWKVQALEQFVLVLAEVDPSWDVHSTQRATDVARLLKKAMGR